MEASRRRSRPRRGGALALAPLLVMALWPRPSQGETAAEEERAPDAEGANCAGQGRSAYVVRELFVALTNPIGFESQLGLGRCWPLVTDGGALFDLSNVEVGAFNYLSASYIHFGSYLSVAPLSVLSFRAEMALVQTFPFPLQGSSYFPRAGYDDSFPSDGITNEVEAEQDGAPGLEVGLSTTVQGAVTLAELPRGPLQLLAVDTLAFEHWLMGSAAFYYNVRRDVILARSDWLLANSGALLLDFRLTSNISLRVGAVDMLVYALGAGRVETNQVGGIATINMERVGRRVRGLQPFVQVLYYTHHATRRLDLSWDVMIGVELAAILE